MVTPEEYIEEKYTVIWLHAIDAMKHILKGDYKQSAYKTPCRDHSHLNNLREEIEQHKDPLDYDAIFEESFKPDRKAIPFDSNTGDLDIDRYLNLNPLCFDDYRKERTRKAALTLALDIAISYRERRLSDMEERHREIYAIACEAEAENRPCRVVACAGTRIPELNKPLKIYCVIKDYQDPIFPGIWAAFKTNATTNDFMNCLMDYLVGTKADGNGTVTDLFIEEDIPADEIILIKAKRIITGEKKQ